MALPPIVTSVDWTDLLLIPKKTNPLTLYGDGNGIPMRVSCFFSVGDGVRLLLR
jgi:hypothetical protein